LPDNTEKPTTRVKYWLIGLSIQGIPLLVGDDDIANLKEIGRFLESWCIFVNGIAFSSSVQKEYLVEAYRDPVWGTTVRDETLPH
jgi:hypothetical protein